MLKKTIKIVCIMFSIFLLSSCSKNELIGSYELVYNHGEDVIELLSQYEILTIIDKENYEIKSYYDLSSVITGKPLVSEEMILLEKGTYEYKDHVLVLNTNTKKTTFNVTKTTFSNEHKTYEKIKNKQKVELKGEFRLATKTSNYQTYLEIYPKFEINNNYFALKNDTNIEITGKVIYGYKNILLYNENFIGLVELSETEIKITNLNFILYYNRLG